MVSEHLLVVVGVMLCMILKSHMDHQLSLPMSLQVAFLLVVLLLVLLVVLLILQSLQVSSSLPSSSLSSLLSLLSLSSLLLLSLLSATGPFIRIDNLQQFEHIINLQEVEVYSGTVITFTTTTSTQYNY